MKAVLMAAGVGSRISREVKKPKSLLDIGNGEVLLRYTVKLLKRHGIDVTIVVGYQKELFYEALKDLDVTFVVNPFYRVSNSIASLWRGLSVWECGCFPGGGDPGAYPGIRGGHYDAGRLPENRDRRLLFPLRERTGAQIWQGASRE